MGRIYNFIFGAILILIVLDSYFRGFITEEWLPFVVAGVGVIMLLISRAERISAATATPPLPPDPSHSFLVSWFFPAFLILMALADLISAWFPSTAFWLQKLVVYSNTAKFIMLIAGLISILSVFANTRNFRLVP